MIGGTLIIRVAPRISMVFGNGVETRIESYLSDWMEREGAPGVSIAVVDGDETFSTGLGSRNLQQNQPATPDTLYGIASCSKSFTATAILQLAEDGELDVQDPIDDHLTHDLWEAADPPITIHDLLTHSSGLPGDGSAFLLLTRELGLSNATTPLGSMEDLYRFAEESLDERASDSGDSYFYHNTGYTLLGQVIENISGQSYATYVQENILDPLDMTRSTFHEEDVVADENALTGYLLTDDGPQPQNFPHDSLIYAAGGLLSSVSELTSYLRMQLNGGEYQGEQILTLDSIQKMRQGYVEWDYSLSGSDNEYGYGWTTKEFMGERVLSHIGDIVVSSAYVGFLPDRELGVALLTNASPEYILQSVGEGVLSILLGGDPTTDVPFWSVRKKLGHLTGRYESYRGVLSGTVIQNGTTLSFESDGAPALSFPIIPETTDPEDFSFYTYAEEGYPKDLRVDVNGDDIDIYLGRWRLHKIADL